MVKNSYPHIRLFQSDFLEKFSYVHPVVPMLVFVPVILFCLFFGNTPLLHKAVGFAEGILSWTLAEYLLHRFVFHFNNQTPLLKRIVYLIHGIHHDDPHDPFRLVAPPLMSIPLAGLFFSLFYFILSSGIIWGYIAGFTAGYLIYDYLHYYFHHSAPKTAYLKYLRKNHYLHHFKTPNKKYGVSSPLWDFIFGTY